MNLREQIEAAAIKKGLTIPVGAIKVRTAAGRKVAQKVVELANDYNALAGAERIEEILFIKKGRIGNLVKELKKPLKAKEW